MSVENGKCPDCGQAMRLDSSKEKMNCEYCGKEVPILQAIQKCQIDGITTFDNIMLAAQRAIDLDEDYDKALKKYKEALDLKPEDHNAMWGMFLCEWKFTLWYYRTKGFVQFPGDVPKCLLAAIEKYGQRAYDLTPDDIKPYRWEKLQEARQKYQNMLTPAKKKGCYIATAVYGSYNAPEVWTLRRYRDGTLGQSVFGRLFIRVYYALSPLAIRLFGKTKAFNGFWKKTLDKKVARLNAKGVQNTPYEDK